MNPSSIESLQSNGRHFGPIYCHRNLSAAASENHNGEQTKEQHHILNGKADEEADTPLADARALPEARTIRGCKWLLACVALFSANLLYGLDTTIAADIQAAVAQTFDEISKLGWLGIGFTLGSVALILPWERPTPSSTPNGYLLDV